MASPAIELRNVAISFGSKESKEVLLRNIQLTINYGETFVLIGPSGHGKSTLLKLMAGLLVPSEGQVLIRGQDWQTMRGSERAELAQKTGMLFQKNALFDSLTVFENVAFPLREVAHASEAEVQKIVERYLEAVGIAQARDLYPDEISGGMQKRLGTARALALEPEIVFYDDPTAGLDPITSRKIVQMIVDLQKKMGTTVVAVTNDMNRAYQMAHRIGHRIGMVVDGELIICGSPAETKAHPDPRVQQFISGGLSGPLTVQA